MSVLWIGDTVVRELKETDIRLLTTHTYKYALCWYTNTHHFVVTGSVMGLRKNSACGGWVYQPTSRPISHSQQ